MEAWLSEGWLTAIYTFVLHDLIVIALIPVVLLRRQEPAVTVAWIFAILLMPFVGALVYVLFGNSQMGRRAHRKRVRKTRDRVQAPQIVGDVASPIDAKGQLQLFKLLERICPIPAVTGNSAEILTDMSLNYAEQLAAIESAQHHVHIEYYIFQPDSIGARFRDALIKAAQRGVEVRFVYDAVGSMKLSRAFIRQMQQGGVKTASFIPLNPLTRRWIFNFRNHRKILVVDGKVGFIGGANIGEEYLGAGEGQLWGDTHVRLHGPVVRQLQRVFSDDWTFASGEELTQPPYYAAAQPAGDVVAQIVPGGPDQPIPVYHELYFSAVANAVEQVRITTPYFVPSEPVLMALKTAAFRGVDVQILVPKRSSHYVLQLAARSYYRELLDAGVKIFEFDQGFMHSKILTIDSRWSVVGTANFDNRSMRLNFEIGVVLYDVEKTKHLDAVFEENKLHSRKIDRQLWIKRSIFRRLIENIAGMFSPVL